MSGQAFVYPKDLRTELKHYNLVVGNGRCHLNNHDNLHNHYDDHDDYQQFNIIYINAICRFYLRDAGLATSLSFDPKERMVLNNERRKIKKTNEKESLSCFLVFLNFPPLILLDQKRDLYQVQRIASHTNRAKLSKEVTEANYKKRQYINHKMIIKN